MRAAVSTSAATSPMVIQPGLNVSSIEMAPTASSLVPAHSWWIAELPGTGRSSTTDRVGLGVEGSSGGAAVMKVRRPSSRPCGVFRR